MEITPHHFSYDKSGDIWYNGKCHDPENMRTLIISSVGPCRGCYDGFQACATMIRGRDSEEREYVFCVHPDDVTIFEEGMDIHNVAGLGGRVLAYGPFPSHEKHTAFLTPTAISLRASQ